MPRAISPGPAGLKFWRAPGLSADNTDDTGSLPASVGDQFNPWGPRRPVQDWICSSPLYLITAVLPPDTTNLPAGGANWFNPWGPRQPERSWTNPGIRLTPVILTAASGSYTLIGTAASVAFGHVVGSGSYSVTGASVALALGHVAGAGSYTLTGTAAGLTVAVNYAAAAGSYTITGSAATFAFGHVAGAGNYVLTGTAAGLVIPGVVDYLPAGMTGSYVPWGRPYPTALLTRTGRPLAEAAAAFTLTAAGGSYTITGAAAALTVASPPDTTNLPAGATVWFNPWRRPYPTALLTRTGRPLAVGPLTLTASGGSYTITGNDAALALRLTVNSGAYALTGGAASLATGFAAGAGFYTLTGTDADLRVAGTITLACGAGSYTITGSNVSFIGITPPIEVTPPPVGGTPAGFRVGRYRQFKLKKKRKHDQCEELLEYLRSLPPAEAEAAVAELPPRYLSLLDGLPLPHALVLPPHPSRSPQDDEDDDDACALLLEMLLR